MAVKKKSAMSAVTRLDRASGVPLYLQIDRHIGLRIEAGEWQPGERIPNESDLCETYGVSRITMRQAITRLVQRGMLTREQGRGTFVRDLSLIAGSRGVTSFTSELGALGLKAGAQVLAKHVLSAGEADVATFLHLDDEAKVLKLRRLRTGNGVPMGIQTSILPLQRFPGIEKIDFENRSLYATLEEKYGVVAHEAYETFTVGGALADDARELHVEVGDHVVNVERISLDTVGPFEKARSVMRGDRYQIRIVLRRN
jgi:GntR family transcriptional regulator